MSGIVGIFERRGSPADRSLLEALTDLLGARGPDGRGTWAAGSAGLGHTLLRTSRESSAESQPASLHDRVWITADARLDRRAELIAEIETSSLLIPKDAPDAELILYSYAIWENDCVRHLRGDFAFAVWDSSRKTLFCARDHFGIKPFYYADLGHLFLFSNSLDCVRAHPDVSDELYDPAIANFLLQGFNSDLQTTSFRDIRRLPPAHFLIASEDGIRTQQFWSPPVDGRIRYRRPADYVEHFQELLRQAVADRLRCDRAGIWMSGGMDSSAVAATARGLTSPPTDLRAYTMFYESLIVDHERNYAQQVADFLGIPIHYLKMDDIPLFGSSDHPALATSEPMEGPFFEGIREQHRLIATDCRVMLSGEGADALLHFQMWPYTRDLFRHREWRRLFDEVPAFLWVRPFPWKGIRQRVRRLFEADSKAPDWVSSELLARLGSETPAGQASLRPRILVPHPFAPVAHAFLSAPQLSAMFEFSDPAITHSTVETRYPFLDLRIIDYLLAIPRFPWAFKKRLLREAMASLLPATILQRPKTPLAEDPIRATIGRLGTSYFERSDWDPESDRYLVRSALQRRVKSGDLEGGEILIRPLCLNFWLQSGRRIRYRMDAEVRNG